MRASPNVKAPPQKPAPARFAAATGVDALKSKQEVEGYLARRGAQNVVVTRDDDAHQIVCAFRLFGRIVQMRQRLPRPSDPFMRRKAGIRVPTEEDVSRRVEAETRRKWRVVVTLVKMKLDAIFEEEDLAAREEMFNDEFLPHIALPQGGTVREYLLPQIAEAYATGKPPALLPPLLTGPPPP